MFASMVSVLNMSVQILYSNKKYVVIYNYFIYTIKINILYFMYILEFPAERYVTFKIQPARKWNLNSLSPNIICSENCQNIILYFWLYFYNIRRFKCFYDLSKSFL